jgi:hypothetical protein
MIVKSQFKKWKWKFTQDKTFVLPVSVGSHPLTILSNSGNVLVHAQGVMLKIKRHYHFDGATCAPDFKRVIVPSAVHDAMLQLADKYPSIVSERMAHRAFKQSMKAHGFRLWPIYYYAVASWPRKLYKLLSDGN